MRRKGGRNFVSIDKYVFRQNFFAKNVSLFERFWPFKLQKTGFSICLINMYASCGIVLISGGLIVEARRMCITVKQRF